MNNKLNKVLLAASFCLPVFAQAGGLHLYEIGTTDMGLAAAGQAARADDASTVYGNPAGMTRLTGNQISFGTQALYGKAEYKQDGTGLLPGNDPGNVGGIHPAGSIFYSHSVSDRFKLGLGLYGNFGLSLDFGSWAGSRYVEEVHTKAASIQPSAAYRINDQWSVGAGLVMSYGYAGIERTQANVHYKVEDHDWSHGWRLGVLYSPTASTRIGLVWQNKIEHDFNTIVPAAGMYGGVLSKSVRPEERMLSVWQQVTPTVAVMGNVGWQGWSSFSNVGLENRSYNGPLRFKDTWHAALGMQYTLNAKTKWNIGASYDTSMYKDQRDGSLILPNGEVWRIGTGIQRKLSKNSELGAAVEYLRSGSSYDQHPAVSGSYEHPQLYFVSVQYSHKF